MTSQASTSTASSSDDYEKKTYTYIPIDSILSEEHKLEELLELPESEIIFANHGKKCPITPIQKKIPTGDIMTYIKGVLATVKNVIYLNDPTINNFPLIGVKFTRSPKQLENDEKKAIAEDERLARIEKYGDKYEGMEVKGDIPIVLTKSEMRIKADARTDIRNELKEKRKKNMLKIFKIYTIGLTHILSNTDLSKGMFTHDLIYVEDGLFCVDPVIKTSLTRTNIMKADVAFFENEIEGGMLDDNQTLAVKYKVRNINEILNPTPQNPKYPHQDDFIWLPFQFNLGKDVMTKIDAPAGNKPDWRLKADNAFYLLCGDITINIGRCRVTDYRPGFSKHIDAEKDRIRSISDPSEKSAAQAGLKAYIKNPSEPKTVVAYLTMWINNISNGHYIHQETATAAAGGLEDLDDMLF